VPKVDPPDPVLEHIKTKAPTTAEWAVIWGYPGEVTAGTVKDDDDNDVPAEFQRLYLDLSRSRWLEINTDNINAFFALEPGRGCLLWVPRDLLLVEVKLERAHVFDSATGFWAGGFWNQKDWEDDDGPGGPPGTKVPGRC
jgi:hypothetical protein